MNSPHRRWRHPLSLYLYMILLVGSWLSAVYVYGVHGAPEYLLGVLLLSTAWILGGRAGVRAAREEATNERIRSYNSGLQEAYSAAARLVSSLHDQHHHAVTRANTVVELGGWTAKQLDNMQAHLSRLAGR